MNPSKRPKKWKAIFDYWLKTEPATEFADLAIGFLRRQDEMHGDDLDLDAYLEYLEGQGVHLESKEERTKATFTLMHVYVRGGW